MQQHLNGNEVDTVFLRIIKSSKIYFTELAFASGNAQGCASGISCLLYTEKQVSRFPTELYVYAILLHSIFAHHYYDVLLSNLTLCRTHACGKCFIYNIVTRELM